MPPSSGIGFSGGLIGAAEGAASSAAGLAAGMGTFGGAGGAASGAMQLGFQELNRAAAFGAQAGGIAVSGLLESLIPTGGSSDWSTTIPGKLLSGIAGVRPTQNTAGQTQPPLPANQTGGGGGNTQGAGSGGGVTNIHGPITVQANNPQQLFDGLTAHQDQQSAMSANTVGLNTRTTGGLG